MPAATAVAVPSPARVAQLVQAVARRRQRRQHAAVSGWWANVEDLEHEGVQAALEARRRVGPQTMDAEAYVARAADMAMGAAYVRMSSPASASDHERPALLGLARAPLSDDLPHEGWRPDRILEQQQWRRRVRQRLAALASDRALLAAVMTLCHDVAPRDAARLCRVDVESVYKGRRRLVELGRNDAALRTLARTCP